jgi:hypothetical protein
MFAVIILGIGFIMVAALFPVAIQQTQASSQDVTASAYAQSISQSITSTVSSTDFFPTGQSAATSPIPPMYASFGTVQATTNGTPNSTIGTNPFTATPITTTWTLWSKISGSLISSTDSRYAWVGFYSRDEDTTTPNANPKSYVNVVAIITQNQNPQASGYTSLDLAPPTTPLAEPATLQGWPVKAEIVDSTDTSITGLKGQMTADVIFISDGAIVGSSGAAASSAFVVVSQDSAASPNTGHWNGHVYRLSNRRTDFDTYGPAGSQAWELAPGQDFTVEPATGNVTLVNATAFVVGRALANTTNANPPPNYNVNTNPFVGGSQAIAAYSFTIAVQ